MKIDINRKPTINGWNLICRMNIGELSGTLATDNRGVYAMLVNDDVKWLNQQDVKAALKRVKK